MAILRVAVADEQAGALKHLLKTVPYVQDVQEKNDPVKQEHPEMPLSTIERIKEILAGAKGKNLFADINDPVEWQRQLRKEWERDI